MEADKPSARRKKIRSPTLSHPPEPRGSCYPFLAVFNANTSENAVHYPGQALISKVLSFLQIAFLNGHRPPPQVQTSGSRSLFCFAGSVLGLVFYFKELALPAIADRGRSPSPSLAVSAWERIDSSPLVAGPRLLLQSAGVSVLGVSPAP